MRRITVTGAAIALAATAALVGAASPASASTKASALYNSIPSSLPGNVVSESFEATETSEFGNQITLSKEGGQLGSVVVVMSSWGCQSGGWSTDDCVTTPGATFTEPITLNIYRAGPANTTLPGALVVSKTTTFAIPFRPSASAKCTGAEAGEWFDGKQGCFNGLANKITFSVDHSVPGRIVFGIAYNTSDYGAVPQRPQPCNSTSGGCGYDSLNVGLWSRLLTGGNPNPGKVFENTDYAPYYCDGGTAGVGIFRLDSPDAPACWGVNPPYTSAPWFFPAVEFNMGSS